MPASDIRLVVVADLHLNHRKSRPAAERQARDVAAAGGDVLLMLGDAATWDGETLDECLGLFDGFAGPKLFVPGNHDLWTLDPANDAIALLTRRLPERVTAAGWHYLQGAPFRADDVAIVGNLGWYDFGFRVETLGIPMAFYSAGVTPGYVIARESPVELIEAATACPQAGRDVFGRWNDMRHVRADHAAIFEHCLADLDRDLRAVAEAKCVVVATHTVPVAGLLPPRRMPQLDFVRAYLGSPALGDRILAAPNVRHVLCGHSHFPATCQLGAVHCTNVGSSYREKHTIQITLQHSC